MKKKTIIQNNVRKYRKANGLTQVDIASLLGYKSSNCVCQIEQGVEPPKPFDVIALSIIFDKPINRLYPSITADTLQTIQKNAQSIYKKLKPLHAGSSTFSQHRFKKLKELSIINHPL